MDFEKLFPKVVESGIYVAFLCDVWRTIYSLKPVYKFDFELLNTRNSVSGFCPDVPLSKSTKLYHWACVLSGKMVAVEQEIDFDKYKERYLRIKVVKYKVKHSTEERNIVADIIELMLDPYEGKKPEYMSDKAWESNRKEMEEYKNHILGKDGID